MSTRTKRTRADYAEMQHAADEGGAQGEEEQEATETQALLRIEMEREAATNSEDERDQTHVDREFADAADQYNDLLKELEPLRDTVRKLEAREHDLWATLHPSCLCRDQIWLKDTEYNRRYDFACQNGNEEMAEMWLGGQRMYKPEYCVRAERGRGIQCRRPNFNSDD